MQPVACSNGSVVELLPCTHLCQLSRGSPVRSRVRAFRVFLLFLDFRSGRFPRHYAGCATAWCTAAPPNVRMLHVHVVLTRSLTCLGLFVVRCRAAPAGRRDCRQRHWQSNLSWPTGNVTNPTCQAQSDDKAPSHDYAGAQLRLHAVQRHACGRWEGHRPRTATTVNIFYFSSSTLHPPRPPLPRAASQQDGDIH